MLSGFELYPRWVPLAFLATATLTRVNFNRVNKIEAR